MDGEGLTSELSDQDRVLLVFGYLGPLALVSLVASRREFVKWHAKQGLVLTAVLLGLYIVLRAIHAVVDRYRSAGLSLEDADLMVENVISTFALPNALAVNFRINERERFVPMVVEEPSVVAAVAAQSSLILGNVVVIERIFLLPGFGDYVLVAIGRRDDLAVVGGLFVAAAILAVVNLFADALLLVVDPRLEP